MKALLLIIFALLLALTFTVSAEAKEFLIPIPIPVPVIPDNGGGYYDRGYSDGYRDGYYYNDRCGWITLYRYEEDYYGRVYLVETKKYHCQGQRD